jgi:hypothetical protein
MGKGVEQLGILESIFVTSSSAALAESCTCNNTSIFLPSCIKKFLSTYTLWKYVTETDFENSKSHSCRHVNPDRKVQIRHSVRIK